MYRILGYASFERKEEVVFTIYDIIRVYNTFYLIDNE